MNRADTEDLPDSETDAPPRRRRWRRKRVLVPSTVAMFLLVGLGAAWIERERIATNIVDDQLAALDLPATYEVERIAGSRQVLRDVVVGDPASPDLTIDRVEVSLRYRLGTPEIGKVTLVNPRLFGRMVDGRMSFGTLDKVIYRDSAEPAGLPEIDLTVHDGRALMHTPYGAVGAKVEGAGLLSDGFEGTLALAAPRLSMDGCTMIDASVFGEIATAGGRPAFDGPIRFASAQCPASGLALGDTDIQFEGRSDSAFADLSGRAIIAAGPLRYADYRASGAEATLRANWKNGLLDLRHTIAARGLVSPQVSGALMTVEGTLRATDGLARLETRNRIEGNGLRPGIAFGRSLAKLEQVGAGTFVAPLAQRFAGALAREARGSAVSADVVLRRSGGRTTVLVPQGELRGGSGERIIALSRVESTLSGEGPARLAGNIAIRGRDMPRITGRMERGSASSTVFRLSMAPYAAGESQLAIPQLSVAQSSGGAIGFAGRMIASGPLPGGYAQDLTVPLSGRWTPGGGVAMWRGCIDVGFERLAISNLAFERRGLRLCPPRGRAIVQNGPGGLSIAAGAPSLDLAGMLGETPIRIASGPVGFAYPGAMSARDLAISLGPIETASSFEIANLVARLGGDALEGDFAGADIRLNAVPLDLRDAQGNWRFADGALLISDGDFRLVDRQAQPRFEPLIAEAGTLTLRENLITADALLRNPAARRVVTGVSLQHDLSRGRGFADLAIPGLMFDAALQPDQLSRLARGVIANADGIITGTGRIDWNGSKITSTGRFSSDDLDFAAAFGPVKGASGTVVFSDLLGLTTAPGQTLRVASVNPGIEVTDGEFTFQLRGGKMLAVEGGNWPFMGGRLILKSVDLNFGVSEARRYVFDIVGLDAAQFVARFELPNIAATGTFDGTVPIIFDQNGNGRVEGGQLVSRAPGGNVSYVGDLSYKDLSTMANFAFDALRSLDYSQMRIGMSGSLTGEIVTKVDIDGVKQGDGAKRNIITRALAGLPIQFRINVRAPFYQLISSFKSLRDPAAVRDPRELGLLSDDGTRFLKSAVRGEDLPADVEPDDIIPDESPVQN
ncbi:YdbH domain-containing protein [Qipengyuania sp.]|uniref:intermembrane phospholipid transport protein YdbH family protein n=1 Tax=Qipengyuania sp. TaxID=2004515 RepID=UPI0035C7AB95